jgi:8-amino-7-oxononanoate synthase
MPAAISDVKLSDRLQQREELGMLRKLLLPAGLVDFCSNDYLSFAQSDRFNILFSNERENVKLRFGSTGSRLISGNSSFAEQLEVELAAYHKAPAALLFNSGYDANLGLFQCIAQRGDTILYDQLCHASIIDGIRLSFASHFKFKHNDLTHLEEQLKKATGAVFVAAESVYSMDGNSAPLKELTALCERYNANLIIDEAHATGIFGPKGEGLLVNMGIEDRIFARMHTFSKALACHGAVVLGSTVLRNYLINFARSFIYTTALPLHSLAAVKASYMLLANSATQQKYLHQLISNFKQAVKKESFSVILSSSAIQSVIIPGNQLVRQVETSLRGKGFDVRAILSPTVPVGEERLRICLHVHNTFTEVEDLVYALKTAIEV